LRTQDQSAAQNLYQRYLERLIGLARKKLGALPRRVADEEDVAHVTLNSFFAGVRDGRFPKLNDRNDLWQILVMLTERKAIDQMRLQLSKKRGLEIGESALACGDGEVSHGAGMEQVVDREPSPELAAELAEQIRVRMEQLEDPLVRQIAVWKMEGRTNPEIARRLGCVTRTVERRLEFIRRVWQSE